MIFRMEARRQCKNVYIRKKNPEMWRYQKLTGSDSAAYRQKECERVAKYNKKKKEMKENDDDNDLMDSEDNDRKHELSRQR